MAITTGAWLLLCNQDKTSKYRLRYNRSTTQRYTMLYNSSPEDSGLTCRLDGKPKASSSLPPEPDTSFGSIFLPPSPSQSRNGLEPAALPSRSPGATRGYKLLLVLVLVLPVVYVCTSKVWRLWCARCCCCCCVGGGGGGDGWGG